MNVFLIDLKNQPGELARLTEAIAQKGINIESFSGATVGGSGSVALVTNDESATRNAISGAGYKARELELVPVAIEHKPGGLAAIAKKLGDAGINIEAALPMGMTGGNVTVAFATNDPSKTRMILGVGEPAGMAVG